MSAQRIVPERIAFGRIATFVAIGLCACDDPPQGPSTIDAASSASIAASDTPAAASASARSTPAEKPPCPEGMTQIESFCVDLYEASLVRASDGAPHSPYERPKASEKVMAVSRRDAVPQAYLDRWEAQAACQAAGKRLCRATEWYRACAGTTRNRFPYGARQIKNKCNVGKGHLLTKVFGKVFFTKDAHYNSPLLNQEPGFLAKSGEFAECVSEDGVYDMVGNLHEWIADDVSAKLIKDLPLEKGDHWLGKRGMGVFMGGYFSSKGEHGRGCLYATATHAPEYHDYSIGFRCCADVK